MSNPRGSMHGTTSEIRPPGRLPGAVRRAQIDPAWTPWLRLVERVLGELHDPIAEYCREAGGRGREGEPLLQGAVVRVSGARLEGVVRDLVQLAAESGSVLHSSGSSLAADMDAVALAHAGITSDRSVVERIARRVSADAEPLGVIAHLAAIPVLHACAAMERGSDAEGWTRGYCPVCAAWPVLAEARGIERTRRLRCGRCASDWRTTVLRCAYCAETRHDRLGRFAVEGSEETRWVETCRSCGGYLKVASTLRALPFGELMLEDLATVELDVAAVERGHARPARLATELEVALERV
jgi:FdhE protein